ncbi:hypothetical protein N0V90_001067 [Kalmusia sp. IMI 367209]|nr:hypothetical protein N0V90_001067 [Kalmusia sp. IMI 367209]
MDDLPFQDDDLPSPTSFVRPPTPSKPEPSPEIQRVLALDSFAEQVDAFAELRCYFRPQEDSPLYPIIQAYLASEISAETAVCNIAEPIEEQYTTADHGRKLKDATKRDTVYEGWTTEGYLWELYYGFLHAARRIAWDDPQQEKLLCLIKALKKRPDPKPPSATMEIEPDWVLSEEFLWSKLSMLGPSTRESWNDIPGCGAGMEKPELRAWTNVNAFVARMARDGVRNYWIYCTWAISAGLETNYKEREMYKLDAFVPPAAVWFLILGKQLYDREDEPEVPTLQQMGRKSTARQKMKEPDFSKTKWRRWKQRFESFVEDIKLEEETREFARRAIQIMTEVETVEVGSCSN